MRVSTFLKKREIRTFLANKKTNRGEITPPTKKLLWLDLVRIRREKHLHPLNEGEYVIDHSIITCKEEKGEKQEEARPATSPECEQ